MAHSVQQRMLKLFKRGGSSHPKESEGRIKLQKELFQFNKCNEHGFPAKPSALAVDPFLQLMAIGTRTGAVHLYGGIGVEFSASHIDDISVNQIYFMPGQGRLVTVCNDSNLYLWEVNTKDGVSFLEQVRSLPMDSGKLRSMSVCCVSRDSSRLLVGTEGGNVHLVDLTSFSLLDSVIYQDTVIQSLGDEHRLTPGAVECIEQSPTQSNLFLLGYSRGLIVLWDLETMSVHHTYNSSQQLESLSWHRDGLQFMSSHNDGSYIVWSIEESTEPKEQATHPYGPFPCKPINKLLWKTDKEEPLLVFTGGMPRASYGERNTVSVMQGENHTVLDFSSRVVDIHVLSAADDFQQQEARSVPEFDEPHTLVCLCDEEFVLIDLSAPDWPVMRTPLLPCVHPAPITCTTHVSNVSTSFYDKLQAAGRSQAGKISERSWPFSGGEDLVEPSNSIELLVTGHEDGSVRFWHVSGVCMSLVYVLRTAAIYGMQHVENPDDQEDWPPFRKVGEFDPFSDDPRLGVQKLWLCAPSETLVVAGTAGQLLVLRFATEHRTYSLSSVAVSLVKDRDGFVWKGHQPLPVTKDELEFSAGMQPSCVVQLEPPAAVTALALQSEWHLLSVGTAHGFVLFDYLQKIAVHTECTLKPTEISAQDEGGLSLRKSLKKSLRQSFRKLRRGRSRKASPKKRSPGRENTRLEEANTSTEPEMKPVERQIEFRDDSMGSVIRCLQFADTFVLNNTVHSASLWVGTNGGHVYIYMITIPANNKRDSENVSCKIAKEIQLRHGAPVLHVAVVDRMSRLLPEPYETALNTRITADYTAAQSVVIVSEEQIKVFELPKLKPTTKQKITAVEGARIRKVVFPSIVSRSDANYSETCVMCLTSLGTVHVYRVPSLRLQIQANPIAGDDHIGINSSVLTRSGQGFYLCSSTQFGRYSLSARHVTTARARVKISDGARPALVCRRGSDSSSHVAEVTAAVSEALEDLDESAAEANITTDITIDDIKVHADEEAEGAAADVNFDESEPAESRGLEPEVTVVNKDGETPTDDQKELVDATVGVSTTAAVAGDGAEASTVNHSPEDTASAAAVKAQTNSTADSTDAANVGEDGDH